MRIYMKQIVLPLASRFPVGHFKRGQLTGFPEKVIKGTKIHTWDSDIEQPTVFIDGKRILNVEQLAANDGMTLDDFVSWFFKTSNTFEGVIIHFTDFRY